jgi:hypothetical protein
MKSAIFFFLVSSPAFLWAEPHSVDVIVEKHGPLVTLTTIPHGPSVQKVRIQEPALNGQRSPYRLTETAFQAILESAKPISLADPTRRKWHYIPWYDVAFETPNGTYAVHLFLDGRRGVLHLPNKSVGYFSYELPTDLMAPNPNYSGGH